MGSAFLMRNLNGFAFHYFGGTCKLVIRNFDAYRTLYRPEQISAISGLIDHHSFNACALEKSCQNIGVFRFGEFLHCFHVVGDVTGRSPVWSRRSSKS